MKKAVILHGTNVGPGDNWFPWLKAKLEAEGYEVWVPQLPGADKPSRDTYGDFLFGSGWDFTDNIVIGHSSGATELLNLLMDKRMPHIRLGVCVSVLMGMSPDNKDFEKFKYLFPPKGFKFHRIRGKATDFIFMHGSDDSKSPLEHAETLSAKLNAPLMVVPNGHHLGDNFTELPQLWDALKPYL